MRKYDYDIIVIGAGVAGGIFVASQNQGKKILVIERDLSEQERIIGELMQPGGLKALEEMGLRHLTENFDAQEVNGYKMIKGEQTFKIEYKEIGNDIAGLGLQNGKFLSSIRNYIQTLSNVSLFQGNVTELLEDQNQVFGVKFTNNESETIEKKAPLTVVCDGPMSFFRSKLSQPNKHVSSYFMGLILKNLELEDPSLGHMILTGEAPILVYPIKTNSYRILIDYPGEKPPRLGAKSIQKIKEEISAVLPTYMLKSFEEAIDTEQIKVMPNHRMNAQAFRKNGVVLLGDSLNMRHPITGGGMTATFNDILSLNKCLDHVPYENERELFSAIEKYYTARKKNVETINILANALYKVFRNEDLKDACFEYLNKGGEKSTGPLSILAGINRNKKYLLKHFFNVALQHPLHFITKPKKQFHLYKNALEIIRPILKDEDKPALI